MSDYHTQAAMGKRAAERLLHPRVPEPLRVFYHIACMGNWKEVVREQLRLLQYVGLTKTQTETNTCILGSDEEAQWCCDLADEYDIGLNVLYTSNSLNLYEGPTINALYDWAVANPQGSVLYFHTKGVSRPNDSHKKAWRRLMQKGVIGQWRQNLKALARADMIGVSWQELPDFPHFCGNFWMARCDWLASLQRPSAYRCRHPNLSWGGYSWPDRMYVETWLGSEPYHHVESLFCRNGCFWKGPEIFTYDTSISGFDYEDGISIELGGGSKPRGRGYVNIDKNDGPGVEHVLDFEELASAGSARLPFADDTVGRVYSSHCFEHIRNLHGLLREIVRVCKNGATVEIVVPHWLHPMAMCHDHKQVIPPDEIKNWTETALDYWWGDAPKRFYHRETTQVPSPQLERLKRSFPTMSDEEIMSHIPGAANEVRYILEVGPR